MESFGDKARACAYALIVHVLCVAVFFVGLLWTQSEVHPISLPGPVIEAELVGVSAAPKARAVPRPKPPPPKQDPQPEPPKPQEPKPEPPAQPQRNDQIEREKIAEMAQQKAERAERAQEERRRQEQVLLEQQQREERDRLKQLEDIKRQREAAEKKRKLEQEKLAQLQDAQKQPKPVKPVSQPVPESDQAKSGTNGQDESLAAQYAAAIQNAALNNWLRPETVQNVVCDVDIKQIPGGDLLDVHLTNPCNADPQTRNTIEQAIRRAAPLPYKGYESVFRREILFTFCYPREVCPK